MDRWSHPARQCHLQKVVANSRFVIGRGVRVKNLASKILAMAQKRLPGDWAQAYGYKPLLLETYVESKRFAATSYRAANWIAVGKTCGRGRQDRAHREKKPIKDIYLYPLVPDCQKRLCEEPGPARLSPTRCGKLAKPARDGRNKSLVMSGCVIAAIESGCLPWRVISMRSPGPIFRRPAKAAPKPKRPIDCLSTRP